MRLLDTRTGQFVEIVDNEDLPGYAILSHVWDKTEQVYQELKEIQKDYDENGYRIQGVSPLPSSIPFSQPSHVCPCTTHIIQSKPRLAPPLIWEDSRLSPKVRDACAAARADGYDLIWIDSCCIDKTSSSELSEAINSMYRWYGRSHHCYAFLADVPDMDEGDLYKEESSFRESKWFKRGWTLQELIAPQDVVFMSSEWNVLGSKFLLADLIESITGIEIGVLVHDKPLEEVSVATRMSWAALRETTRVEDRAYSLFGMFGVNMFTLYGEGSLAFRRLQLAILDQIPDQSIFAWAVGDYEAYLDSLPLRTSNETILSASNTPSVSFGVYRYGESLLAGSPEYFQHSGHIRPIPHHTHRERLAHLGVDHKDAVQYYTSTAHGIRTELPLLDIRACLPPEIVGHVEREDAQWYLSILGCTFSDKEEEHFVARVCYTPSSQSGLEFLRPGYLGIEHPDDNYVYPDIVMLRYSEVEQCVRHLAVKTIYIPHPKHPQPSAPGKASVRRFTDDVHIIPSRWAGRMLEGQGYAITFSQPSADGPCSCRLTVCKGGETIHIRCLGKEPDSNGDMRVHAEASISTDTVSSASDDGSTSSDYTWFLARERQKVFNVDATTVVGTIRVRVVLKRTSESRLVLYARISDTVSKSDGDGEGKWERWMQTLQSTRERKVTVSWEEDQY